MKEKKYSKKSKIVKLLGLPVLMIGLMILCFGKAKASPEDNPQPVWIQGTLFSPCAPTLNLDKRFIPDLDVFIEELHQLDGNNRILLNNTNLTQEDMDRLIAEFPDMRFVWTIYVKRWSIRTDAKGFSTLQPKVITHMLDDTDVQVFKYCTDLVALDLGHNRITDISPLQGLTKLRALILVDNPISDITIVENFHELMYFESFCTRIADYSPLSVCENIVDLNISYSRVSDITPLMHFPKLERLWFTHTQISEANRNRLLARYPNVKYDYTSGTSIEAGWRNHTRFNDMRQMYFKKNEVFGYFLDTVPDDNYDYICNYKEYIFDPAFYAALYPQVAEQCEYDDEKLFRHFLYYGIWEKRIGISTFAVGNYQIKHPELRSVWGDHLPGYYAAYIKECIGE
ncbi:MAG: leucine-rich repeat domain-containing protein [Lachnospiraceae bacterium]|nr:leucine-rich repeat domain-containing protein [Lachnospiraceae bacterium]